MDTVLITGAARGIGKETARIFAENGYRIIINYKTSRLSAEKLSAEIGAIPIKADISNANEVLEMFAFINENFGGVDVLINNAAISRFNLFTDISDAEWREMMAINLDGTFFCSRAAIPYMVRQKRGKIVNVSSIWGITGSACEVAYSTTKAAIIGMTHALAKELGPSNIQVNCVAPGVIDTDMMSDFSESDIKALIDDTPLMRLGKPRDVAEAIFFLASEKADFITGQVLSPNGGMVI
ncbi:MAG: 3-oxoacyl-ACP reductase FabG [Oscillospiraceae bacterium]